MSDRLLNVEQAREKLGNVSKSFVYKLCKDGVLCTIVVGKVRGLRIYASSLKNYIDNKKRDRAA